MLLYKYSIVNKNFNLFEIFSNSHGKRTTKADKLLLLFYTITWSTASSWFDRVSPYKKRIICVSNAHQQRIVTNKIPCDTLLMRFW